MSHIRHISLAFLLLLAALSLPSCGAGGGGEGEAPLAGQPEILSTSPVDGAQGIEVGQVAVTFARPLVAGTIATDQIRVSTPAGLVSGTVSYDAVSRRLVFEPGDALDAGAAHTARLEPGFEDVDGNVRTTPYEFRFVTRDRAFPVDFVLETHPEASYLEQVADNDSDRVAYLYRRDLGGNSSELHIGAVDDYETWLPPVFISRNDQVRIHQNQALAVSAARHTIVTWTREVGGQRDAWFRYQRDGVVWLTARALEERTDTITKEPLAAIDAQGNALLVWVEGPDNNNYRDVRAAWATSGGALYGPTTIDTSSADVGGLVLAMNSIGQGVIAWSQKTSNYHDAYACRFDLTGFGEPEPLEAFTDDHCVPDQAVMREDGTAVVLVRHMNAVAGAGAHRPFTVSCPWNGSIWSNPAYTHGAVKRYRSTRPRMDGQGTITFAWSTAGPTDPAVRVSSLRITENLSRESLHEFPYSLCGHTYDIRLVGRQDGSVALAWSAKPQGATTQAVVMAVRPAGMPWTTARVVANKDTDVDALPFDLDCEPGGGARIVYTPYTGLTAADHQVFTRTMRADGQPGAAIEVDRANDDRASTPALRIGEGGGGVAIWERNDDAGSVNLWGATLR